MLLIVENMEEINFKDYYYSLDDNGKSDIRTPFVTTYKMGWSTFFKKLGDNSWTVLEFEKLEELTGKKFTR